MQLSPTLTTTSFSYDAGGARVKTVEPDGTIIHTPFPNYEVENPGLGSAITRSTYSLAGQVIAVRVSGDPGNDGLYYIHTDHLGSIRAMSDVSGTLVTASLASFYPFGEFRGTPPGTNPEVSDRGFTGHRDNGILG